MATLRKPLQGVKNIIRFNWPFFVAGIILLLVLLILFNTTTGTLQKICLFAAFVLLLFTIVPLLVSLYIYDLSGLYSFKWLKKFVTGNEKLIVNINAGFDETSEILQKYFQESQTTIFDFYDETKHTEPSIKRARNLYPADPTTKIISTSLIPLTDNSANKIFLIFVAHEIRNHDERVLFFEELKRVLSPNGQLFVMEHLRDVPSSLAYNIGVFHFYSKKSWQRIFNAAGIKLVEEIKHTPFISIFVLEKDGTTH